MIRKRAGFILRMSTRHYGNADSGAVRQGLIPERQLLNQEELNKSTASLNRLGIPAFGKKKTTEQATLEISPNAKEMRAQPWIFPALLYGEAKQEAERGKAALLLTPTGTGQHLGETLNPGVKMFLHFLLGLSAASGFRNP